MTPHPSEGWVLPSIRPWKPAQLNGRPDLPRLVKETKPLALGAQRGLPRSQTQTGRVSASSRCICLEDGSDMCVGSSESGDPLIDWCLSALRLNIPSLVVVVVGRQCTSAQQLPQGWGQAQESPTRADFQGATQNSATKTNDL